MRWKRLCVDVAADGTCRGGSIEWHPDDGELQDPDAILVMAYHPDATPEQMFLLVLAEPWYEPELPFPSHGSIIDGRVVAEHPAQGVLRGLTR